MYVLQMYYFLSLFLLNKSLKFVNIYHSNMPLIKLDAIDSTNDYLKQFARKSELENYTIVLANEQTNGKGQMGAKWISEPGKNLTMSILVTTTDQPGHQSTTVTWALRVKIDSASPIETATRRAFTSLVRSSGRRPVAVVPLSSD